MAKKEPDPRAELRKAGRASAVGWEFAIAVVLPMLGGWWLDGRLNTAPVLTMVGLGLGSATGFWLLYKTARQLSSDAEALEREEREERRKDDR